MCLSLLKSGKAEVGIIHAVGTVFKAICDGGSHVCLLFERLEGDKEKEKELISVMKCYLSHLNTLVKLYPLPTLPLLSFLAIVRYFFANSGAFRFR